MFSFCRRTNTMFLGVMVLTKVKICWVDELQMLWHFRCLRASIGSTVPDMVFITFFIIIILHNFVIAEKWEYAFAHVVGQRAFLTCIPKRFWGQWFSTMLLNLFIIVQFLQYCLFVMIISFCDFQEIPKVNNLIYVCITMIAGCKKITSLFPLFLTQWGRVTHICISKLIITGSDNGLSPGRLIGPLGVNFI